MAGGGCGGLTRRGPAPLEKAEDTQRVRRFSLRRRRFQRRSDVNAACQSLYSIGQQVVRKPEPPPRRCLGFPHATAGLWQPTEPPLCPATWGCALPPQRHRTLLVLTFFARRCEARPAASRVSQAPPLKPSDDSPVAVVGGGGVGLGG